MRIALAAIIVVGVSGVVIAQAGSQAPASATPPVFEAASIKRNDGSTPGGSLGVLPGGRYVAINMPLATVIRFAYPATNRDIVGAPAWLLSERYDVNATAGREATRQEIQQMVKAMVDERMKLKARVEEREQDVYELVRVRPDAPLAPAIRETAFNCDEVTQRNRAGERVLAENGAPACGMSASGNTMRFGGSPMAILAASMSGSLGRPVIDRTGLSGRYEFMLQSTINPERATDEAPVVFTALQEQLGLKLQSARGVVTTLVIEYVERPSEN